jgi:hypothetical protein
MTKTRVFISFDYDYDLDLKNMLVGQSKNPDSPFEIADWSIKDPSLDWKQKARTRIRASDVAAVICGEHTDTAVGVATELSIAQEESKPYFLLHGRRGKVAKKPTSAKATDKVYDWTWDNLKRLIRGAR